MNYLAHVYLAHDTANLVIGSMLGDFVKGSLQHQYTSTIRHGIELHRQIDYFTDCHPIVQTSKQLITPQRRRFAGIMVDLFYDHFLAKHWPRFCPTPLFEFSQQIYAVLENHLPLLPDRLQHILPYMIEQNWLTAYQEIEYIGRALNGISRRLKRSNSLFKSVEELEWNYAALEQHFQAFLPELIQFVEHHKLIAVKSADMLEITMQSRSSSPHFPLTGLKSVTEVKCHALESLSDRKC